MFHNFIIGVLVLILMCYGLLVVPICCLGMLFVHDQASKYYVIVIVEMVLCCIFSMMRWM